MFEHHVRLEVVLEGGAVGAVGAGVGPGARVGLVVFTQASDGPFHDAATRGTPVLARGYLVPPKIYRILWWCLVLAYWWRYHPAVGLVHINHARVTLWLWHVTNGKS